MTAVGGTGRVARSGMYADDIAGRMSAAPLPSPPADSDRAPPAPSSGRSFLEGVGQYLGQKIRTVQWTPGTCPSPTASRATPPSSSTASTTGPAPAPPRPAPRAAPPVRAPEPPPAPARPLHRRGTAAGMARRPRRGWRDVWWRWWWLKGGEARNIVGGGWQRSRVVALV